MNQVTKQTLNLHLDWRDSVLCDLVLSRSSLAQGANFQATITLVHGA